MKQMHYKKRLKYLNAVADHLISLGYQVNEPTHDHDLLDVWGTIKGRKCYIEIYVTMYECDSGINGIWHYDDNEGTEMFLSNEPLYGLDTRWCISCYFPDDFKSFKKGKLRSAV
jgi:hypothetical protein